MELKEYQKKTLEPKKLRAKPSKFENAKELGIKTLTEEEFKKMIS